MLQNPIFSVYISSLNGVCRWSTCNLTIPQYATHVSHSLSLFSSFCYDCSIREEEQEELDTSTESKEAETKEDDLEGITDDEDDVAPNKKKRGGKFILMYFSRSKEKEDKI